MPALGAVLMPAAALANPTVTSIPVTMTVEPLCRVTGATVHLGTYTSSQTWGDVAAQLGENSGDGTFKVGLRGKEYAQWGSVKCDNGVSYTLKIGGTDSQLPGGITFAVGGEKAVFSPLVLKIGDTVQANDPGLGRGWFWRLRWWRNKSGQRHWLGRGASNRR